MEIIRDIEKFLMPESRTVVTMGNFDGIHLGHQVLVGNAVADARGTGARSVVLTFDPHPLKLLLPEHAPRMILSQDDKIEMLQGLGVDAVIIQQFDRQFASIDARHFVQQYLFERLRLSKIWVGRDLRFGRGRVGGVQDLIRWGSEVGFNVGVVEPILVQGARVSSSRIRQLIEEGRVDEVEPMLGRYHFLSGIIVSGNRRGRELGFPTANLSTKTEVLPRDGIYATLIELGSRQWLSVTNIGVNPTFGAGPRTVETFILDFVQDIYGESVKLFFVKRIREERRFDRIEDLVIQMDQDVKAAREIFDHLKSVNLNN
jgi:riboflavin kinase/FMN adenylyltransferase